MLTFKSRNIIWIHGYQRIWRIAFLVLLVVALNGPWFFELTWVPTPYFCSAPHVRLDENYCGTPSPITWLVSWFFPATLTDFRGLILSLFTLLPLLPLLSITFLIWRGNQQHWRTFHIVVLGLAAAVAGLFMYMQLAAASFSSSHWLLWGIWLYMGLAVGMLLLESLTFWEGNNLVYE